MNARSTISVDMLMNMEMLAITNPAMKDILEKAKVIYSLAGSPDFFDEITDYSGSIDPKMYDDEYD